VAAWVSRQNWTDCGARSVTFTGTPAAGNLATYSSPGPTRDGRQKPDIAAPGVAIGSTRSDDNGAVACPGAVTTLLPGLRHYINSGTSMAAPHVTGAVALLMQKFGAVTPAMAKTHLTTVALLDGFTGAVWNNSWGNGKLRVDVTDPVATVTAPNGGEILYITTNTNLTWTANDPILFGPTVTIDILLSRTGSGGPYTGLATGHPNTGSFNWNVTGPPTADAWVKIVAIDPVTNQGTDISDAQFTIANQPVPVELALFLAEPIETGIKVSWKFNEDVQFAQVAVERGDAGSGPFSRLESSIETDQDGNSVVVDNTAEYGHTYFYRLVATSRSGQTSTFGPMSAIAGKPYTRFDLAPVWPNPSTGLARIDFTVPQESRVKVLVFDIQGRQVATLADGSYSPGKYQVTWDGSSETGEKASSGMYFVHMVAPDGKEHVQRVALAR
jgi:subtilisin family serine protease